MSTDHIQAQLEAEKRELEEKLASVGRPNPGVPNDWEQVPEEDSLEADPIDQADVISTRQNDAALLAALEAQYDNVLAALARLAQGTYGMCEVCGEPVEADRLAVNPSATTCKAHMR